MHITRISYRQVKNLGNYQTKTIEAEIGLDQEDDVDEAYESVKDFVLGKLLGGELGKEDLY